MKKKDQPTFKKQEQYNAFSKSIDEVIAHFNTDKEKGLTKEEAKKRLEEYGPNKIEEAPKTPFIIKLLKQFIEPMVIVLLIAALISMVIFIVRGVTNVSSGVGFGKDNDEWIDVIVIFAIVIINALIGAIQEQKAEQSLEALKKLSTPMCVVKRDGQLINVKSEDLVLGDIVIIEDGSIIPADLRLITSVDLKSDESSLTGESVPVNKDYSEILKDDALIGDKHNMAFSSCPISYGRGEGVVVATGMSTEVGKIASMLDKEPNEETPLQKKLAVLSKQLGIICLIIVVATFVAGTIWNLIHLFTSEGGFTWAAFGNETLQMFEEAIALAVAAIPEGLSAIVTIALALGMGKMVKVNTIVRKLPSVETLGSVTVVCSDKTGTLTQNKMTIKKVYIDGKTLDASDVKIENEEAKLLIKGMMLCCNASIAADRYGDPTELALLDYAKLYSLSKEECEKTTDRRIDELPFDSIRKMMSVENVDSDGLKKTIYTKGALDSILKHVTWIQENGQVREITKDDIDKINAKSKEMALDAFRVLAFAYKGHKDKARMSEEDLIFVGMVGMIDPEREEAKPAVATLKEAGIRTVMITGDHKDTAFAIAKNIGITNDISRCMSGEEINALTEEELKEAVNHTDVFSRVSPENKVQIVKALKENGNIASMTGDGVNDAPSLKAADIGIAMGITGTDVAKSAADMVLTDDNFASIEKAVEEGRGIFSNVKKAIIYLLSSNFGEVMVMFLTIILGMPTPLETLQILWINLITDSLPAIALSMDGKEKDIMKQKPKDPKDGFFAHGGFKFTMMYGSIIFIITFIAYIIPGILAFTGSTASFAPQIEASVRNSWGNGYNGFIACLNNFEVHREATTWAFTVLAMSQVFHMVGMSDIKNTFLRVFKNKNWMMLVSFIFGFVLQIAVTEIPFMEVAFKTTGLQWQEWLILIAFAIVPLIVHEILAPVFKKKNVQII